MWRKTLRLMTALYSIVAVRGHTTGICYSPGDLPNTIDVWLPTYHSQVTLDGYYSTRSNPIGFYTVSVCHLIVPIPDTAPHDTTALTLILFWSLVYSGWGCFRSGHFRSGGIGGAGAEPLRDPVPKRAHQFRLCANDLEMH
jgi:hypothetical protein